MEQFGWVAWSERGSRAALPCGDNSLNGGIELFLRDICVPRRRFRTLVSQERLNVRQIRARSTRRVANECRSLYGLKYGTFRRADGIHDAAQVCSDAFPWSRKGQFDMMVGQAYFRSISRGDQSPLLHDGPRSRGASSS